MNREKVWNGTGNARKALVDKRERVERKRGREGEERECGVGEVQFQVGESRVIVMELMLHHIHLMSMVAGEDESNGAEGVRHAESKVVESSCCVV